MTTYHIDPVLGSDANDGSNWGASYAWKTIKTGATVARIAPADIIKIAKSPAPTSIGSATWTDKSKTVTLATACTANIDLCESAWAATANVTQTLPSTARKEGATNVMLAIGATFTTGKAGYRYFGSGIDFSSYQQISFWFRTNLAIAANVIRVCLCSDSSGDVIVDSFYIEPIETAQINAWIPITINKGSALGSSIQSINIYCDSDPGTISVQIDDIIAVKSSASADSLSLTSLISKNSAATGGTELWYPIQSINGTTVLIDNGTATLANAGRGYSGDTETVTTYKRECFRTLTTTDCTVQDSGTSGNLIEFQGGYDPSSGNQDGETYFDARSCLGTGLDLTGKSFVRTNRIGVVRALTGITLGTAATDCDVTAHTVSGCGGSGITIVGGIRNVVAVGGSVNNTTDGLSMTATSIGNALTIGKLDSNISNGLGTAACYGKNHITLAKANNNGAANISFGALTYDFTAKVTENKDSAAYGVDFVTLSKGILIEGMTTSGNTSGAINHATLGNNFLMNCTLGESTKVAGQVALGNSKLASTKQDGSWDNNYIYTDGGTIKSQTTIRHTAADIAWQLSPTSANRGTVQYPLVLSVARLAVNANAQVTFSAWLYRDNSGIQAKLLCQGLQVAGVENDVLSSDMTATSTWEQRSITFTPTESAVVEIQCIAFGGTTYSAYIDDVEYYQA